MKKIACALCLLGVMFGVTQNARALLISSTNTLGIITAPEFALDDEVTNTQQEGFNERRGVLLTSALGVDGGTIGPGIYVDSHMIFLNKAANAANISDLDVEWGFDGTILGVMSDTPGLLEGASPFLGALGTTYPGGAGFSLRGMEGADEYSGVSTSTLTVSMIVSQPGDWIRVVTLSTIPEPSTVILLGLGMLGLGVISRRRQQAASDT